MGIEVDNVFVVAVEFAEGSNITTLTHTHTIDINAHNYTFTLGKV